MTYNPDYGRHNRYNYEAFETYESLQEKENSKAEAEHQVDDLNISSIDSAQIGRIERKYLN